MGEGLFVCMCVIRGRHSGKAAAPRRSSCTCKQRSTHRGRKSLLNVQLKRGWQRFHQAIYYFKHV